MTHDKGRKSNPISAAFILAFLTLGLLALSGCTSSSAPGTPAAAASTPCAPIDQAGAAMVHVDMANMAYAPIEVRVAPGTWVMWMNKDSVGHTVTPDDSAKWGGDKGSGSDPSKFLNEGDSWSFCFTTPGTYAYHCVPHASRSGAGYVGMVGKVVVG